MGTTTTKRAGDLVSQREAARDLGLSVRAIQDAVDRGMPRHRKGQRWGYDLRECRAWYRARKRAAEAETKRKRKPRSELDRARLRKAVALCVRSERALADLRASVLPASDVPGLLAEVADDLRTAAAPLPKVWARRVVGLGGAPDAADVLADFRDALLEALRGDQTEAAEEQSAKAAPVKAPTTLQEARARRWNADAELVELRAGLDEGDLDSLDSVEGQLQDILLTLRWAILGMPGRLAQDFVRIGRKPQAERRLRSAVAAALSPLDIHVASVTTDAAGGAS